MRSYFPARAYYKNQQLTIKLSDIICLRNGFYHRTTPPLKLFFCKSKNLKDKRIIIVPQTRRRIDELYEIEVGLEREEGSTAAICGFLASENCNIEWCQAVDSLSSDYGGIDLIIDIPDNLPKTTKELETYFKNKLESPENEMIFNQLKMVENKIIRVRRLAENLFKDFDIKEEMDIIWNINSNKKNVQGGWDEENNFVLKLNDSISLSVFDDLTSANEDQSFFFVTVIVDSTTKSISLEVKHTTEEWIIAFLISMPNRSGMLYQLLQLFKKRDINLRVIDPQIFEPKRPRYLIAGNIKKSIYRNYSAKTLEPLISGDLFFNNPAFLEPEYKFNTQNLQTINFSELSIETQLPFLCLSGRKVEDVFNLMQFEVYERRGKIYKGIAYGDLSFEPIFLKQMEKSGITRKLLRSLGYQVISTKKNSDFWKRAIKPFHSNLSKKCCEILNAEMKYKKQIESLRKELLSISGQDTGIYQENSEQYQSLKYSFKHFVLNLGLFNDYALIVSWTCESRTKEEFSQYVNLACLSLLNTLQQQKLPIYREKDACLYFFLAELIKQQISREPKPDSIVKFKGEEEKKISEENQTLAEEQRKRTQQK